MWRIWAELTAEEVLAIWQLEWLGSNTVFYKNNSWVIIWVNLWAAWTVLTSWWTTNAPTFNVAWVWDMVKVVYDPTNIEWDAFDMDNMIEWTSNYILTPEERAELVALRDIQTDTNEPTGFIREFPATMWILELSPDWTTVYRIDQNWDFTSNTSGNFADWTTFETPATMQTTCIYPVAATWWFDIYIEWLKYNVDELLQEAYTPQSWLQFCYFTVSGWVPVLNTAVVLSPNYFEDTPIISIIYGNITTWDKVVFADERHGITMSWATHRYLHFTEWTKYVSGLAIEWLWAWTWVYTQVASWVAYDEDIDMTPSAQTDAPFWYRVWSIWTTTADWVLIAYMWTTYAYYNEDTGGWTFQLTEIWNNNYTIMHFVLTNDAEFPIVKILSQTFFNTVADAQAWIIEDANNLALDWLPTPEFLFIGSVIIDDAWDLKLLSDWSEYYDLRASKIGWGWSASGSSSLHADLLDLATSWHNADIIVNTPAWDIVATDVQGAINELDTEKLSSVAVSDLDNWTDWELITWSAAWAATTVAVWTADQVLTSNWVWVAPTFQDAWGSASFNWINWWEIVIAWEVLADVELGRMVAFDAWTGNEFQISADTRPDSWTTTVTAKLNWATVWTATITDSTTADAWSWLYIWTSTDFADSFVSWWVLKFTATNTVWVNNLLINTK